MNVNTTIASVGMALLLVVSVFPPGMVGTADAQSAPNDYTIIQGGECWEVTPYEPGDPNPDGPGAVEPHVNIVDETEEFGTIPNSSWDGSPTVESVMDYRYRDPEGGASDNDQAWGQIPHYAPWLSEPYWKDPWQYGTYGLYNWSENQESHMFFYSGPEGDSVVMRHDKMSDDLPIGSHGPYNGMHPDSTRDGFMTPQPGRSAVSFTFLDLPAGEWAYMDDMYPEGMDDIYYDSADPVYDGDQHTRYGHRDADYPSQPLENYGGGTDFTAHWTWGDNRTDGGAYRGLQNLGDGDRMVIEPRFNEESYFWDYYPWRYDRSEGDGITDWVVRRKGAENVHLNMDQRVAIVGGAQCTSVDFHFGTDSGSATVEVGEEFDLNAQVSGGSDVRYNWDLDGDGQFEVENETNASVSHTYGEGATGNVSVTLLVEDGELQDSVTKGIRVEPREPPETDVSVSGDDQNSHPEYHVVGETLTFDATNTTDNVALNESSAVWRVDGNVTATGQMQYAHAFDETGDHEVSFTVSDEVGHESTQTTTVRVDELDTEDPTARAEVTPGEVEAGAPLTFDASESEDERGIAEYRWDFTSDGEFEQTTGNATSEFGPYGAAGEYDVTLEVEDANGNVDNATTSVAVFASEDPNVTAMEVPDEITANQSFELRASAEDNGEIDRYEWYVGTDDDPDAFGAETTYAYEANIDEEQGVVVTLVVYDTAGNQISSEETVLVQPPDETPPTAELTVSTDETKVGEDVTFDASGSTDSPEWGGIDRYEWDFDGDGEIDRTTENATVTHSYGDAGTYDATVTVVDGNDNADDATVQVVVEAEEKAIGGGGGSGGSSGGGSTNLDPPPVMTQVEERGPNEAVVDVQNARSDETVTASFPESEVAAETGVQFRTLEVNLGSDDPHVVFETAASADAPESVPAATGADETMAYLDLGAKYLDGGVENATVEFAVEKSALPELTEPSDVALYRYDGGWERLDTAVVDETDDGYRLAATTDSLGTLAVGTTRTVSATDADLAETTVVSGGTVEASATVENAASETRTVAVNLIVEGTVAATETVEVPAGETADVALSATARDPGTYEVAVGDASAGTLTVEDGGPANVDVVDVTLSESSIDAGEEVEITAIVENAGGETGTYDVTLTLFGDELRTETVEVAGGETREVTFVQRIDAGGTYTVEVNGETARLEVTGEEKRNDDLPTPGVPGFGVGTALVALLAAALLARFRG